MSSPGVQATNPLFGNDKPDFTRLAGLGAPAIVALSSQSRTNAAPTTVSYVPPSSAGMYRVSVYLDVTTGTTITFKLKATYTDPAGSATTDGIDPFLARQGSGTLGYAANTADRYSGVYNFATDASGGTISFLDNAGTYTTCAYRLTILLEKVQ